MLLTRTHWVRKFLIRSAFVLNCFSRVFITATVLLAPAEYGAPISFVEVFAVNVPVRKPPCIALVRVGLPTAIYVVSDVVNPRLLK